MTSRISKTLSCVALSVLAATGQAHAQAKLLRSFSVVDVVFSPGMAAGKDNARLSYQFADTAVSFSIVVFANDAVTPVDTLVADGADSTLSYHQLTWDGRRWDNTAAAEGRYVITISATGKTRPDTSVTRPVFVDRTKPAISIQSVMPEPFAPNVASQSKVLVIRFNVIDSSPVHPDRNADEIKPILYNSAGTVLAPDTLHFVPLLYGYRPTRVGADGLYEMKWDVTGDNAPLVDGTSRVVISIVDDAFSLTTPNAADALFLVDVSVPKITIESPVSGQSLRVMPDSIFGWAYDKGGIDSLRVRYDSRSLVHLKTTFTRNDTVFFSAPLADSVFGEDEHKVQFTAEDIVGHVGTETFLATLDTTPPSVAPSLDSFEGIWHTDRFPLTGTFPPVNNPATIVRVYRNSVLVDSIFPFLVKSINIPVQLLPGLNVLTATMVDKAKNESVPSNAVTVRFDNSAGVFIPAPFRPDAEFMVNTSRPAIRVEIAIYDLGGNFVHEMQTGGAADNVFAIRWSGLNMDGRGVRKGPLIAVVRVTNEDMSTEVFREAFLFDPQ